MAETAEGKKKVYVHGHTKDDGTKVKTHIALHQTRAQVKRRGSKLTYVLFDRFSST